MPRWLRCCRPPCRLPRRRWPSHRHRHRHRAGERSSPPAGAPDADRGRRADRRRDLVTAPGRVGPVVDTADGAVDPHARRPSSDRAIVATPLPVTLPAGPPAGRGAPLSTTYDTGSVPPDPPYVTTTMSSHQVAPVPRGPSAAGHGRGPATWVVRHVDPWSVFKIAIVFNLVAVCRAADRRRAALERGVRGPARSTTSSGSSRASAGPTFQFDGGAIYHVPGSPACSGDRPDTGRRACWRRPCSTSSPTSSAASG